MDTRRVSPNSAVGDAMSLIGMGRKEQARFAAGYSSSELGRVLARDGAFRAFVNSIAGGKLAAADVAAEYFPDAAKRRAALTPLIELAAREAASTRGDQRWSRVELALVNAAPASCWIDDDLLPGEPRRALQDRARASIAEGCTLIARLGASHCLACAAPLPTRTRPTPRSSAVQRWERVRYCGKCEGRSTLLRQAHEGLIRRVMVDVAESYGVRDAASRRRIRRSG